MASTGVVRLNVGGSLFATTLHTMKSAGEASFLASLARQIEESSDGSGVARFAVAKDDTGAVFIDREGTLFRPILNFLRTGDWVPELASPCPADKLKKECDFYGVELPHELNVSDQSLARVIAEFKSGEIDAAGEGLAQLCELMARSFLSRAENGKEMAVCLLPCQDECERLIGLKLPGAIIELGKRGASARVLGGCKDAKSYAADVPRFVPPSYGFCQASGEEYGTYRKVGPSVLLRALKERYGLSVVEEPYDRQKMTVLMLVSRPRWNSPCSLELCSADERDNFYIEVGSGIAFFYFRWTPPSPKSG